jgi:hypothetical protein
MKSVQAQTGKGIDLQLPLHGEFAGQSGRSIDRYARIQHSRSQAVRGIRTQTGKIEAVNRVAPATSRSAARICTRAAPAQEAADHTESRSPGSSRRAPTASALRAKRLPRRLLARCVLNSVIGSIHGSPREAFDRLRQSELRRMLATC